MKRYVFALFSAFSLSACAQGTSPDAAAPAAEAAPSAVTAAEDASPGSPAAKARNAILSINPRVGIESVSDAPLPGFQEVIVAGQVLYVSDDGRYVLQGSLYIERGGEYNVIDTRTGEHIETRFRVPEGARRVKYAG